ncbi:Uncharacterised protein [Clostridioides difficile]|nr:Uncharacterised protein [Clostridioides difficile]VIN89370.1 Uncharacterised protein [Clostridioides difficile]
MSTNLLCTALATNPAIIAPNILQSYENIPKKEPYKELRLYASASPNPDAINASAVTVSEFIPFAASNVLITVCIPINKTIPPNAPHPFSFLDNPKAIPVTKNIGKYLITINPRSFITLKNTFINDPSFIIPLSPNA